jgi:hypothetical protein
MNELSLSEILGELPLNKTVLFDDAFVCLQITSEGAVLSAELLKKFSTSTISNFLESAFHMTLYYEAGLAIDDRDGTLLITQWLPSVKSWLEAEAALEKILNQLDHCRTALLISKDSTSANSPPVKGEQRIRSLLRR